MIIHAEYRHHISYAIEREASLLLRGELDDSPVDDVDDDAAEICRMIELSGMIGLECVLLASE